MSEMTMREAIRVGLKELLDDDPEEKLEKRG